MSAVEPELDVAVAAMIAAKARFVVVGGFAVIANRFVRATEDIDFLAPEDAANDQRILAALISLDAVRFRDDEPLHEEHLIGQAGRGRGRVFRREPAQHRRLQALGGSPSRPE
jgi:Nucleotidyl transferase AbiEii toxin, Type IV TA system